MRTQSQKRKTVSSGTAGQSDIGKKRGRERVTRPGIDIDVVEERTAKERVHM